jgi:hypothetical protein
MMFDVSIKYFTLNPEKNRSTLSVEKVNHTVFKLKVTPRDNQKMASKSVFQSPVY